jgi:hypothetical protein
VKQGHHARLAFRRAGGQIEEFGIELCPSDHGLGLNTLRGDGRTRNGVLVVITVGYRLCLLMRDVLLDQSNGLKTSFSKLLLVLSLVIHVRTKLDFFPSSQTSPSICGGFGGLSCGCQDVARINKGFIMDITASVFEPQMLKLCWWGNFSLTQG